MRHPRYQCLVFDWDGTLIDSIERIVTSLQTAAKKTCDTRLDEQAAKDVIGMGLMDAVATLLPDMDEQVHEATAEAYKQDYLFDNTVPCHLFDGTLECLDECRARGYQLAIATGKSRIGLDRSLEEHGLLDFFHATRCAGEFRSKPDPEMLLDIASSLDITTASMLMIGDSEHDLKMANNASVDAVAVTTGAHSADVLSSHAPLTCLHSIKELSGFLGHN